jgi:hypothetical protein
MTLRERAYQWVYETKEIVCLSGDEPRFIAAYEAGWTAAMEEAAKIACQHSCDSELCPCSTHIAIEVRKLLGAK